MVWKREKGFERCTVGFKGVFIVRGSWEVTVVARRREWRGGLRDISGSVLIAWAFIVFEAVLED